jgi:hypothetical protein
MTNICLYCGKPSDGECKNPACPGKLAHLPTSVRELKNVNVARKMTATERREKI